MSFRDDLEAIRHQADSEGRSSRWYQNKIRSLGMSGARGLMLSSSRSKESIRIGSMYLFFYEPKYKDTLPYYDIFPLVLPFDYAPGGFRGINLHYVPPLLRVHILEKLIEYSSIKKITEKTRLRMSWELLSTTSLHPLIAPCVKQYLYSHVKTSFMKIEAPDWKIAALLPVENFQKKTRLGVFQKSRRISKNRS